MTDIEKKALALLNEVMFSSWLPHELERIPYFPVVCRAIEQHEAFRQEVSDALREWGVVEDGMQLSRFIIAKPDPLVGAWMSVWPGEPLWAAENETKALREAIEERGGKIVWEGEQ